MQLECKCGIRNGGITFFNSYPKLKRRDTAFETIGINFRQRNYVNNVLINQSRALVKVNVPGHQIFIKILLFCKWGRHWFVI